MPSCALPKTQLAPITETSSHMLLEPLPLFVFVIECRDTRHFYGAGTVASPDTLERVVVQILLMSVGGTTRAWVGYALQMQSGGTALVIGGHSGGNRGGHVVGSHR